MNNAYLKSVLENLRLLKQEINYFLKSFGSPNAFVDGYRKAMKSFRFLIKKTHYDLPSSRRSSKMMEEDPQRRNFPLQKLLYALPTNGAVARPRRMFLDYHDMSRLNLDSYMDSS